MSLALWEGRGVAQHSGGRNRMHWLIDGHNLIGAMPGLSLSDVHDEDKLLEYLRRYRARTGHRLTVIFDAGQAYQPATTQKSGGITVQFAPHGKTADRLIMRRLRRVRNPQAVKVVTSDRQVQQSARQQRVRVVSAQEFAALLQESSPGGAPSAAESKPERYPSEAEVEEWLDIFSDD